MSLAIPFNFYFPLWKKIQNEKPFKESQIKCKNYWNGRKKRKKNQTNFFKNENFDKEQISNQKKSLKKKKKF